MRTAIFSFHGGHSGEFCRHAEGRLEEVVRAARAAGFSHFGISEHMPRERPEFLYADEEGLTPADLRSDRYRRTLRLRTLIERGEVDTSLRHRELVLV